MYRVILMYQMSLYWILKGVLNSFKFLWLGDTKKRGIPLVKCNGLKCLKTWEVGFEKKTFKKSGVCKKVVQVYSR